MVIFDRKEFDSKCKAVMMDVRKGEATSPAWVWMTIGAALGFIASCLKLHKEDELPKFKAERKAGSYHGFPRG